MARVDGPLTLAFATLRRVVGGIRRNPIWWVPLFSASLAAMLANDASASCSPSATAATLKAHFQARRGVNLHNWFTWAPMSSATEYRRPVFAGMQGEVSAVEARMLKSYGFDFVRLTVDPVVFMTLKDQEWDAAELRLSLAIDRLRSSGLAVIVDQHPVKAISPAGAKGLKGAKALQPGGPYAVIQSFVRSSARLAAALDRRYGASGDVAFELMNEPSTVCGDRDWAAQQIKMHRAVRAVAPRLTIVLTGACFSAIDGLLPLDASTIDDPNTLYTFHFYDPIIFTHQGVDFMNELGSVTDLPYPADTESPAPVLRQFRAKSAKLLREQNVRGEGKIKSYFSERWNAAVIAARLDKVVQWGTNNCVAPQRILMGEFGVNRRNAWVQGARGEDAVHWIRDVRIAAEARGLPWAIWTYRGVPRAQNSNYDLFDAETQRPYLDTLDALGMKVDTER